MIVTLSMVIDPSRTHEFFRLFQNGVEVLAKTGCSIRSFLCDQLGSDPQYVSERILTVFMNGRPVDDIDGAIIRTGSTLSLSAAAPGLVGATVRRGGAYAGLRNSITHREEDIRDTGHESTIKVKLFNLVVKELGPLLLERGILISGSELEDVLAILPDDELMLTVRPISPRQ